jgi:flagellin
MIQIEIDRLIEEINSIATNTEFNRMRILNGEADRITELFTRTGTGDTATLSAQPQRGMVTPLLVKGMSPGRLDYTINQPGRMAVMEIDTAGTLPAGAISINGFEITVNEGDTFDMLLPQFHAQMGFAGISVQQGTAGTFLVTNVAGSNQHITITGDEALRTALFGAQPDAVGSDAEVTIQGKLDITGTPVTQVMSTFATGNKVYVRGNTGEDLRLNIQVQFCADENDFRFGNGELITADTELSLNIRAFGPIMLQINPSHNTAMSVQIPRLNAETLGLVEFVGGEMRTIVNYQNQESAGFAIGILDRAIDTVSQVRSRLGAYQNRLESTVRSLDVAAENTETSRSRIQDADIARESTRFAQYNVMFQAAMAILGQANQRPQQIISLLQ